MKLSSTTLLALTLALSGACAHDDDDRDERPRSASSSGSDEAARTERDADHSDVDVDDADETSAATPTAQDHPIGTSDEDITRAIRQAIVGDGSMSIAARNVTIVTESGEVTLRGAVRSAEERSAVERHARGVHGVRNVNNLVTLQN